MADRELLEALHELIVNTPELNMSNYDVSEVELQNAALIEAHNMLRTHLGKA